MWNTFLEDMVMLLKLYAVFGRKPLSEQTTEGLERLALR
jgi:hypothetical protein